MIDHAQEQAAADIDQQDDDAGDGIAANEPARPIHGPEEVRLAINLIAAPVGLVLVDQAGMQVGIDGHLPPRQPIEREPRGHFADAGRPLGDHHKLDHDQDREQDHADDHLVAGHERAKRPDHAPRRLGAVDRRRASSTRRAVATFKTNRVSVVVSRIVGKRTEFLWRMDRQRGQEDDHGDGQVGREQHIEHHRAGSARRTRGSRR